MFDIPDSFLALLDRLSLTVQKHPPDRPQYTPHIPHIYPYPHGPDRLQSP